MSRSAGIEGESDGRREPYGPALLPELAKARWRSLFVVSLALLLTGWALFNLARGGEGFALLWSARLHGIEETISAVARIFAALVLCLFVAEESGPRLVWVAAGLVVLGLGHLVFGIPEPLLRDSDFSFNESLYEALITRTFAVSLLAIGLTFRRPPVLTLRAVAIVFGTAAILYMLLFELLKAAEFLPRLAQVDDPRRAVEIESSLLWLTPWHWVLSALPLAMAVAAAVGAYRQSQRGLVPYWLFFAVVLFAGSLLHEYVWPSVYGGEILTTADVLRLAFAVVLAVGGVFELGRMASQRAALLATERERTWHLSELAALKRDFSAMVAHELGSPLATINVCNEILENRGASPEVRDYAISTIRGEIAVLSVLVSDVRSVAAVERDDFSVELRALPLGALLPDAERYVSVLRGDHRVETRVESGLHTSTRVLADPQRVLQVLRNLLSNAARYSPAGSTIELRVSRNGARVRIEVADNGPGIQPEDLERIFEKYDRGGGRAHPGERKAPGAGLGLYLSRRIMRSHGSELTVETGPGKGSVFAFELEVES